MATLKTNNCNIIARETGIKLRGKIDANLKETNISSDGVAVDMCTLDNPTPSNIQKIINITLFSNIKIKLNSLFEKFCGL